MVSAQWYERRRAKPQRCHPGQHERDSDAIVVEMAALAFLDQAMPDLLPDQPKGGQRRRDTHDWVNLFVLTLTLIAAGMAAWFTGQQAERARQQSAVTREDELRQLRAYVGVQSVSVRPMTDGQRLTADILIKNFGQTPASDVQIFAQPAANENPDFSEKAIRGLDHSAPESLFPGAERPFVAYGRLSSSNEMLNRPSSVTSALVYGVIWYRDIFGIHHATEFCHMVSPGQSGHQLAEACQGHNNHN